jgi:hypothetical protein
VIRGALPDGTNGGRAVAEHITAAQRRPGGPPDLRYAADPGDFTGATTTYSDEH